MPPVKCPTPTCTFLFDPSKVPAGAVLECPRCRNRFSLAQTSAPANLGVKSGAEKPAKGRGLIAYLGPVLLVMLVVGGLVTVALLWGGSSDRKQTQAIRSEAMNFAFTPPTAPWEADEETKSNRLGVNVAAFRRSEPEAWVALAAKDYETRTPKRAELDAYADDRLRRLFDNLNKEEKPGGTWAGQPAHRVEFRATAKGTDAVYAGEVYAMSNKGVAYWYFAWAPQGVVSKVHEEFDPIRERLTFLAGREKWKEAAPVRSVLTGSLGYTLTDPEGIWSKTPRTEPKDEDPKADLVAEAIDAAKGQSMEGKPSAHLVAFVLDGTADPLTAARKYVEERHNRDPVTFGPVAFEELVDPPMEGVNCIRLKLTRPNSPTSAQFLVVAGIDVGGKVVAVELRCPWGQRGVWEKRLVALAGTITAEK